MKKKKDEEETGRPSSASSSPKKMNNKVLKMKDPNAPHRPVNPFMLYLRKNRARMKQQHPEASVPDITKLLSQEWMKLSEEEKKPYAEEAAALKVKYLQDLSAYMESDAHQSFKRGLLAKQSKKGVENVATSSSSSLVVPKKRGRPRKIRPGEEAPPSPSKTPVKTRIPLQVKKESQVNQTVSIGNIKVFTDEFLENNRERESELRKLRKLATDFEEQNAILSKHIDNMKAAESKLALETLQMNERNQSVEEHLLRLKKEFVECFATVAIPGTKEYPSLETVDEYLDKLHRKLTQGRASADSSPQDTQSIRDKVVDFVTRFANLDVEV